MSNQKICIHWLLAFILASLFLSFSHFESTSNDSKYYTTLVVRYKDQSWQNVLAPKWGVNFWNFDENSYMRDQLPGQVLAGVALANLGIPATQSLHILGMAYQILSILLLSLISQQFVSKGKSSVLLYSLLLTPLAFSYNIRANHELGIMFFSFLALYSGVMLNKSKSWIIYSTFSSLGLLWIKGPFFIFGTILLTIGFVFSPKERKKYSSLFLSIFVSNFFVLLSALLFELLYQSITHQSFFATFWKIQFQQRAFNETQNHSFLIQKILNFYYYFWHYFTYALPVSLLIFIPILKRKSPQVLMDYLKTRISLCFFTSAMSFCLLFSLSNRIAARYVFPGYYLFAAWLILSFYNFSETFKKLHLNILKFGIHLVVPFLWLICFVLHFL